MGRAYRQKGYHIPEAGKNAKGIEHREHLPLDPGEKVTAMVHTRDIEADDFVLVMVTKNGTCKRLNAVEFKKHPLERHPRPQSWTRATS